MPAEPQQTWIIIISAIFTGLTTLLTLFFTLTERARNQAQVLREQDYKAQLAKDLALAKAAADLAARKTVQLEHTVQASKKERGQQIEDLGKSLKTAIDENTIMNKDALEATNGVNLKIEKLGLTLAEQKGAAEARAMDHLDVKTVTIDAETVDVRSSPKTPAKT